MATAPTQLLGRLRDGDATAAAELIPLVYQQLRALAGGYFRNQPASHTLQPTALVHEAFLRMVGQSGAGAHWKDRAHVCAACAVAMRQILTDHARRRQSAKRGGGRERLTLAAEPVTPGTTAPSPVDAIALDEALQRLAERSQRQARIVECRFFGGLTVEEAACALGISVTTAEKEWRVARAWLSAQLSGRDEP